MRHKREWILAILVAASTALYFAVIWRLDSQRTLGASFDTYHHFYANMLYLADVWRDGGRGFWWNPYQSCGTPFFGTLSNGTVYPGNVLFLLLEPNAALLGLTVLNLTIAGIATYALCREYGIGPIGACCGAIVFQLGNGTVDVTTWEPVVGGPYVWLPAAMLFCERTLRTATLGNAVGLAVALSLALLPGFPQLVFFTYQLIILRLIWRLVGGQVASPGRAVSLLALGLILPPLLTAVQLFPAVEMVRASMRGRALAPDEVAGLVNLDTIRRAFTWRFDLHNPFMLLPALVGACAGFHAATRRVAAFYLATGALYLVLALGTQMPLYAIYYRLPLGALFRDPSRFLWVTNFCFAMLAALGVEALRRVGTPTTRLGAVWWLAPPLVLFGLSRFALKGLSRFEWTLGSAVVATAFLAALLPRFRGGLATVAALLATYGALAFPIVTPSNTPLRAWSLRIQPSRGLLPDGQVMLTHAALFADLRARMSAQDRVYLVHGHPSFDFPPKAASLFRVPSIQNYEPQPTRRSAEYFVMLRTGAMMERLNEFYIPMSGMMPPTLRRRLLDLAAARYIVADVRVDTTATVMQPPLRLLSERDGLRVYENTQALPRAFYVPRIGVVGAAQPLLHRLAEGVDDLRRVALLESPPANGFIGTWPYDGQGTVRFVIDEPEHVVLEMDASARGFLFLSDHHFPGWEATVNGVATPIVQANYMFRLIETPAGRARIEFRYRPASLRVGAIVSALTVVLLAAMAVTTRRP